MTQRRLSLIVNGFDKEVLNKLPMEFAVEAQKLLEISLEDRLVKKYMFEIDNLLNRRKVNSKRNKPKN